MQKAGAASVVKPSFLLLGLVCVIVLAVIVGLSLQNTEAENAGAMSDSAKSGMLMPGEDIGINPQPEPPDEASDENAPSAINRGDTWLNPQPEPPLPVESGDLVQPGEDIGINPQPEPPGDADIQDMENIQEERRLNMDERSINPQPEPPAERRFR